ncbi:MAG: hypothetical protein ACRC1D_08330 [Culicoidibacterales bacterium]
MSDTRIYQLAIGVLSLFSLSYLGISLGDFIQLYPQFTNLALFEFPLNVSLSLIQIILTSTLATVTLILSSFAFHPHQLAAYFSVISFGLMYVSREIFMLIQMNLGILDEPFYNFSFIYLGVIMLIEMALVWIIPRFCPSSRR